MKKIFLGVYNPSIILTYVGVFCALIGMGILLAGGPWNSVDRLQLSMLFLVCSGVCDLFDGRVARLCKRNDTEKRFGIQLDSLADVISFVAFPACMLLFVTGFCAFGIVIACFYVFAGIMRLGWFNVTAEESGDNYRGLPVTFAAVVFPIFFVCLKLLGFADTVWLYEAAFSVLALLFILNFRFKKPGLVGSILLLLLAIAAVVALILI